ncbi:hypothetical protein ACWGHM_00095 [Streptomyces sp. NPDC054904]
MLGRVDDQAPPVEGLDEGRGVQRTGGGSPLRTFTEAFGRRRGSAGEYQAVFSLGRGFQQFAGPWLMTSLVVGAASTGWPVLAALFALLGLAAPPMVRGLEKARARTEPATA